MVNLLLILTVIVILLIIFKSSKKENYRPRVLRSDIAHDFHYDLERVKKYPNYEIYDFKPWPFIKDSLKNPRVVYDYQNF